MNQRLTRRGFLAGTAAAGAGVMFSANSRAQGANDDIRVAVIGFNGQGKSHINGFKKMKGVRLVALCDADQAVIDRAVAELQKDNIKVETTQDMRRIFDRKDIDAISTATPNHWHALTSIWAIQSGKDVYVEKPVSHNVWEGRKIVEAARKYGRIVQTGTQKRSSLGNKAVFEYMQSGQLGKILWARGFCYKRRDNIGKTEGETPVAKTVDYDLWTGPAPMEPLKRKKLHYDWHWVWPTGNGDIGNQGIHEMDLCRWALGEKAIAPRVLSFGGRFGYDDDATTPNTQVAIFDYEKAPLIFEVRGLPSKTGSNAMDAYRGVTRVGIVVQCEGGYFAGGENGGWIYDKENKRVKQFAQEGAAEHKQNFIDAVRARKQEVLTADIEEGHLSSALCHMANVSYRLGKETKPDQIYESVKNSDEGKDSLERLKSHLAANGVDVEKEFPTLGPSLAMNPKTERFTGPLSEEANKLLARNYREPFVVPEKV